MSTPSRWNQIKSYITKVNGVQTLINLTWGPICYVALVRFAMRQLFPVRACRNINLPSLIIERGTDCKDKGR